MWDFLFHELKLVAIQNHKTMGFTEYLQIDMWILEEPPVSIIIVLRDKVIKRHKQVLDSYPYILRDKFSEL